MSVLLLLASRCASVSAERTCIGAQINANLSLERDLSRYEEGMEMEMEFLTALGRNLKVQVQDVVLLSSW